MKTCSKCRLANPTQNRQRASAWYYKNKDRAREARKQYYHKNTQLFRDCAKRWKSEHRQYFAELEAQRRARKRNAAIGCVDYSDVLERDGYWCYLCESDVAPDDVHFDHVIPLSKGGSHSMENIKVTHSRCNLQKGGRVVCL